MTVPCQWGRRLMSLSVIRRILESPGCAGQDVAAWALLIAMANRANDDGTGVWESVVSLSKRVGFKRRADEVLSRLIAGGFVRDTGKRSVRGTRVYDIVLEHIGKAYTTCEAGLTPDVRVLTPDVSQTHTTCEQTSPYSPTTVPPQSVQSTQPVPALAGGVVESIDILGTQDTPAHVPVGTTAAEPPPQTPPSPPCWQLAAWNILDGKSVPDKVTPDAVQFARDRLNEARDLGVGRGRLVLARRPPPSPLMEALRKDDPALWRACHWAWNPRVEEGNGWYKEQGPLSKALARNLRQSLLDHCPESYDPEVRPWWMPPGRPPLADGSSGNTSGVDCCPVCRANGSQWVNGTSRAISCACLKGYAWALKSRSRAALPSKAPSAQPSGPGMPSAAQGRHSPLAGLTIRKAG